LPTAANDVSLQLHGGLLGQFGLWQLEKGLYEDRLDVTTIRHGGPDIAPPDGGRQR
jgi:hypothetical protein